MKLTIALFALVGWSTVAAAQIRPADIECKKTETQAECFTRLKCKADEELEACQKRLRAANGAANNNGNNNNGQNGNSDRANDGRGDRDNGRGDRDNDRDNDRDRDNGRGDRDNDRGRRDDRDSDGGRDRGDGGRRGRARSHRNGGHGFEANKTFGLGLELGEPDGINGKVFVTPSGAIDFGVGYIYSHYYYGDGLHLYGDYLFHPVSLASTPALELPFYVGVGLRYWAFDYCDAQLRCDYRASAVGVRVPLGISFDFNNVPLDIFVQFVPVIDFLSHNYYDRFGDREHLGIDFSVGIRFWFK